MILFNGKIIPFTMFPNGETVLPKTFFEENKAPSPKAANPNTITFKYEADVDLLRLMLVRQVIDFPCHLRILYLPYSRMDRESKEYAFTLKAVANYINWMKWDRVTIYEPHSDVTPALIDNCETVYLAPMILRRLWGPAQLFYPDAGAQKRYNFQSPFKSGPELVGFKRRDFSTGRITEYQVLGEREQGLDHVIMVDDLCSKGGTFMLAAEKLRAMGFKKIELVVGHCEETIWKGDIFKTDLIDHVYTTDSIIAGSDGEAKLTVYPITQLTSHA